MYVLILVKYRFLSEYFSQPKMPVTKQGENVIKKFKIFKKKIKIHFENIIDTNN